MAAVARCVKPLPRWRGREPVQTDGWGPRGSGFHYGSDMMWPQLPGDPCPAGELRVPNCARRFISPDKTSIRVLPHAPAVAICDGEVIAAGRIPTGDRVMIRHAGGLQSGYYHLRGLMVKEGDRVRAGQPLGWVSHDTRPGAFKLAHLHFELRVDGSRVNPWPRIRDFPVVDMPSTPWPFWAKLAVTGAAAYAAYRLMD